MAINPAHVTRPIRVVHVLHTMDYGGVETIIINWLRTLSVARVEAHVVCFANPGRTERLFVEAAGRAGLTVQTIPWNRLKPVFRSAAALERILKETGADIVHTHNTYADIVGLIAARRLNLRTASSLYVWADFGWKRNLLQRINLRVLRHFDLVTAQCARTLRESERRGIPTDRLRALHSGYEPQRTWYTPDERLRLRREQGIEDSHILLANFARYYPEKAQDVLLREFARLAARDPRLRLWLVGRGPDEARLRALVHELGLESIVQMKEFTSRLDMLAQLSDIQVHPSHAEGIPMAILMGMSLGLPIVASGVGGIGEVIRDGQRGLLVPAAGEESFAPEFERAIDRLVESRDERTRLGSAARRFIEDEYSLKAAAERLEHLYAGLCA